MKLLKIVEKENIETKEFYKIFNDFLNKKNKITYRNFDDTERNKLIKSLSVYKKDSDISKFDYSDFAKFPKLPEKNININFIPNKDGSIVKGPIHALVGEAGPEIIIPLNKDGIKFLNDTMKEFKEENYKPVETPIEKNKNVIKRIKKAGKYTDTNMFDLKNLSTGFIGIV